MVALYIGLIERRLLVYASAYKIHWQVGEKATVYKSLLLVHSLNYLPYGTAVQASPPPPL